MGSHEQGPAQAGSGQSNTKRVSHRMPLCSVAPKPYRSQLRTQYVDKRVWHTPLCKFFLDKTGQFKQLGFAPVRS